MKYLRIIGGAIKWTVLAAWGWTVACNPVLAQAPTPGGTGRRRLQQQLRPPLRPGHHGRRPGHVGRLAGQYRAASAKGPQSIRARTCSPAIDAASSRPQGVEEHVQADPGGVLALVALALQRVVLLQRAAQIEGREDHPVTIAELDPLADPGGRWRTTTFKGPSAPPGCGSRRATFERSNRRRRWSAGGRRRECAPGDGRGRWRPSPGGTTR